MRATLGLLEKITLTPSAVEPEDLLPLRAAGVSDQAIEDAIVVCTLFNIINRLADAFEVQIPSAEDFARAGEYLLARGYA
jgi:alkylhydroperoxidase family enzyme